ncbi:MAG TPA: competence/damage-inducible protein A [Thermoleophilaceae bacterium]
MTVRAGIVVTGTEVLSGKISDRNGPWLAERLFELGIDLAHVTICGDRPQDMTAQLRFLADEGVQLIVTSGGLGPTADDLTAEVVAEFQGRPLELDAAMEAKIARILEPLMKRFQHLDRDAVLEANRKQALVPHGATPIDPAGTAPGLVVPPAEGRGGPTIVVMPGPPRELQAMWPIAVETDAFQAAVAGRPEYRERMLRLFGIPESEIAETLRAAERQIGSLDGLEITTCLRRGEVELSARFEPSAEDTWDALEELVAERHEHALYSRDGTVIDEQIAKLLEGHWIATAESCTGGLLAARLTERPGSSAYVAGGVVSYSNEAKSELLGVDPALIAEHGAVSKEVAEAMADGALARFEADLALAITGVAGPGGGTTEKPVGYVCWCVKSTNGECLVRDTRLPGDRADVRDRSTTVAMHLLRRVLVGEKAPL